MYGLWLNKKAAQKHGSNVKTKKSSRRSLIEWETPLSTNNKSPLTLSQYFFRGNEK